MPRIKKPLREKRMRAGPSGRKFFPDDPFPTGVANPEARSVKPKVPGSRDRVHRGEQDIDQKAGRRFPRKASLKRNPWKFDG